MKEEKKKIKEIQDKINKLSNEKYAIEQKEIEDVQYPRVKALVGVCIKSNYDNCYYRKILDYVENKKNKTLYLIFEEFHINKEGEAHFHISSEAPYTNKEWWGTEIPLYGYSKITEQEYQREKTRMFGELAFQNKLRKFLLKG